jgi:hypothetical protein
MQWILYQVAYFVAGFFLPIMLVSWLRKPAGWWSRAGVATVICWVALVLLGTLQHYTIGERIPAYISSDNQEPVTEWRLSNPNIILYFMLTGWLMPAMTLLVVALVQWLGQLRDDATS